MQLVVILVLSLAVFRVVRFILEDTLIREPREWARRKLMGPQPLTAPLPAWRRKGLELMECHWCMGVWVSAGAIGLACATWSVPQPFWSWLAVAGGAAALFEAFGD